MITKPKRINPYANLKLRNQLYLECRAMAEFALSKGKSVPSKIIRTIEKFESEYTQSLSTQSGEALPGSPLEIDSLVDAHDILVKIVEPATPQTILLLDIEQDSPTLWRFLGPVALVRQMMTLSIFSLIMFITLAISDYVDVGSGSIFKSEGGWPLLVNLLFYLASAAMGASFSALYMANAFITKGTFDPTHQASYWIRYFLGLISGLVMAVVISEDALKGNSLLEEGIVRPLLAIVGGFSADLVYTFLSRMVETLKSLFQGSTENMVAAQAQEAKAKLAGQAVQTRVKLASDLMKLQQELSPDADPSVIREKLNSMLDELMPNASAATSRD